MQTTTTNYKTAMPEHTPWGKPDHVKEICPGMVSISTPSHGGLWLAPSLNAKITTKLQAIGGLFADHAFKAQRAAGWYEEDCDWTIVAAFYPEAFEDQHRQIAKAMLIRWYGGADVLAKLLGRPLTDDELSHGRM